MPSILPTFLFLGESVESVPQNTPPLYAPHWFCTSLMHYPDLTLDLTCLRDRASPSWTASPPLPWTTGAVLHTYTHMKIRPFIESCDRWWTSMRWLELAFCWNFHFHRSRFFVWSSCVFLIASFSFSICLSSGCAFLFFLDRYIREYLHWPCEEFFGKRCPELTTLRSPFPGSDRNIGAMKWFLCPFLHVPGQEKTSFTSLPFFSESVNEKFLLHRSRPWDGDPKATW